jgi:hypothetical protein
MPDVCISTHAMNTGTYTVSPIADWSVPTTGMLLRPLPAPPVCVSMKYDTNIYAMSSSSSSSSPQLDSFSMMMMNSSNSSLSLDVPSFIPGDVMNYSHHDEDQKDQDVVVDDDDCTVQECLFQFLNDVVPDFVF